MITQPQFVFMNNKFSFLSGQVGWIGSNVDLRLASSCVFYYINDEGLIDFHCLFAEHLTPLNKTNWVNQILEWMN